MTAASNINININKIKPNRKTNYLENKNGWKFKCMNTSSDELRKLRLR